jgi:hypothetical protein
LLSDRRLYKPEYIAKRNEDIGKSANGEKEY